ncbi:hypothetical protein Gasu2_32740 [Galdieria sulphuraria]|nr:hypothetical protein Gasu2_32740 [Galdieria sulphuraria]
MDPYNGYMAETSEAYFWALELAPQKKETFIVNPDHVLHLTMASFGTKLVEKDRAPISMQVKNETLEMPEGDAKKVTNCTLCVLLPGVMESIPLNVILSDSTDVTFTNNSKSNTVYLTGYMTVEDSFGGYEGSSDEDFEEEEEEDSEEDNEEEQKIPVKKEEDKVQKQGNVLKGAKQTPSLPQKKQGNKEEEESDEDDIFMEEDLSDDFDLGEDSEEDEEEESDEEELQPKATNQRAKVGQRKEMNQLETKQSKQ